VYWSGINPNCFSTFVSSNGTEALYYGDDSSGYAKKMFEDTRSDSGSAISVEWSTKSFNQKVFSKYKKYFNPTFQFKNVTTSGALTGDIIIDGLIVTSTFAVNQQSTGGAGVGVTIPGFNLPGDAPFGITANPSSADVIVEVKTVKRARSIKFTFRSNSATARYKFLALAMTYAILSGKPLLSGNRYYVA
jgi:hypothetical protein